MFIMLLIVLIVFSIPLIRLFLKRIKMQHRITKVCRASNFEIIPTHFLWFLGRKNSFKCDLFIETKNQIISVKLFSILKHNSILIFDENGTYIKRNRLPIALSSYTNVDSKAKIISDYNFKHNYLPHWEIKTPKNILLINPVCNEIIYRKRNGKEILLGAGDVINGMHIYSLSRFIGLLEGIHDSENI